MSQTWDGVSIIDICDTLQHVRYSRRLLLLNLVPWTTVTAFALLLSKMLPKYISQCKIPVNNRIFICLDLCVYSTFVVLKM